MSSTNDLFDEIMALFDQFDADTKFNDKVLYIIF